MATERLTLKIDEKGALVVSRNVNEIGKSAKSTGGALTLLKRALGALAVGAAVKQFINLADTFTVIQNKLKIVTTGTQNLADTTEALFEIAKRTRSSFEATADSYSKFALSAKESGRSQEELLYFTELVNKAVIIGGSTASEAAGGLRQLSQGIASGALRGDELISVLENLPFVADTIAKELGVTRGALRDMGKEGKITADIVLDAFKNQADFLEGEYAKTTITVSQSVQLLKNSFLKLIGDFDSGQGITVALAGAIQKLSEWMENLQGPMNFIADVFLGTMQALKPVVIAVVDKFNEWGVNSESLKTTLKDIGLAFVALLRTAAQVVDGVISSFMIVGKVIGAAVFGGMHDAQHYWKTGWQAMEDFVGKILNDVIRQINELLNALGIDGIDPILPKKFEDRYKGESFEWGKTMGQAVRDGWMTPLTGLVDEVIENVTGNTAQRAAQEAAAAAGGGGSTITTGDPTGGTSTGETAEEAAERICKANKKARKCLDKTAEKVTLVQELGGGLFDTATRSLMEFTQSGRFLIREFVSDVLAQLARIAAQKAFAGMAGGIGLPGFNTGGSFTVGGQAGVDKNLVAFRATKGEQVSITPKGQQGMGGSVPSVAAPNVNVKIVNVVDPSVVTDAMNSEEGEEVIINTITRNSSTVAQAIS
jgi:tape measure domain-containing protein